MYVLINGYTLNFDSHKMYFGDVDVPIDSSLALKLSLFAEKNGEVKSEMLPDFYLEKFNSHIEEAYQKVLGDGNIAKIEEMRVILRKMNILNENRETLEAAYKRTIKNALVFKTSFISLAKKLSNTTNENELSSFVRASDNSRAFAIALDALRAKHHKNYAFYREIMHDFGIYDEKQILSYFNDKIDPNYSTNEFGFASLAKKSILDLQEKVINDAVALGYSAPSDLPRYTNPNNALFEEKVPERKTILISSTMDKNLDKISEAFLMIKPSLLEDGVLKEEHSVFLRSKIKEMVALLQKEEHFDGRMLFNLFAIQHDGLSQSALLDWAKYSHENGVYSAEKAYSFAISAIRHANRLVDFGILKTEDGKNFVFTHESARTILYENLNSSYNAIADAMVSLCAKALEEAKPNLLENNNVLVDFKKEEEILNKKLNISKENLALVTNKTNARTYFALMLVKNSSLDFGGFEQVLNKELCKELREYANGLVSLGIVKKEGDVYTCIDEQNRSFLYRNDSASISVLEKKIKELNALNKTDAIASVIHVDKDLIEKQKAEFDTYLYDEYLSTYKSIGRTFGEFSNDVLNNTANEYGIYMQYSELRKAGDTMEAFVKVAGLALDRVQKKVEEQTLLCVDKESGLLSKEEEDIINTLYQFDFDYSKSEDIEYVSKMKTKESFLLKEVQGYYLTSEEFQKSILAFFESGEGTVSSAKAFATIGINPYSTFLDLGKGTDSKASDIFIINLHRKVNNYMILCGVEKNESNKLLASTREMLEKDVSEIEVLAHFEASVNSFAQKVFERRVQNAQDIAKLVCDKERGQNFV